MLFVSCQNISDKVCLDVLRSEDPRVPNTKNHCEYWRILICVEASDVPGKLCGRCLASLVAQALRFDPLSSSFIPAVTSPVVSGPKMHISSAAR